MHATVEQMCSIYTGLIEITAIDEHNKVDKLSIKEKQTKNMHLEWTD